MYENASIENINIIRANECDHGVGNLRGDRFRAMWNEIEKAREVLEPLLEHYLECYNGHRDELANKAEAFLATYATES